MAIYLCTDIELPKLGGILQRLLEKTAGKYSLYSWQLKSRKRTPPRLNEARKEFCYTAYHMGYNQKQIAIILNRERSTVSYLINTYNEENE